MASDTLHSLPVGRQRGGGLGKGTLFLLVVQVVIKFRTIIRSVNDKYADDDCINPALKWKMVKYKSTSVTFAKEICIFGQK